MRNTVISAAVLVLALAACGTSESTDEVAGEPVAEGEATEAAPRATATLETAEGKPAGRVTATADGEMLKIALSVVGLAPGEHGVHVHTTGSCEAETFESAGGHWNPSDDHHGLEGPAGQHAGDMPNLTVAENGRGALEYTLAGGTFDGLLDADGAAFIVHAMRDDQVTDPSGNSGDRIACGVFGAG